MVMDILHSILHVVIGYGILSPSPLLHEMVAETAVMHDDALCGEVVDALDEHWLVLAMDDAMGEYLDDATAILCILIMEVCVHAAHQVGMSGLQVVECVLGRLQLDSIWNMISKLSKTRYLLHRASQEVP